MNETTLAKSGAAPRGRFRKRSQQQNYSYKHLHHWRHAPAGLWITTKVVVEKEKTRRGMVISSLRGMAVFTNYPSNGLNESPHLFDDDRYGVRQYCAPYVAGSKRLATAPCLGLLTSVAVPPALSQDCSAGL
ncbi:hypothetical protein ACF1BQ_040895 [Bradyrhizobium sp. RDT10]